MCVVIGKITPEHKVRKKAYTVVVKCNEEEKVVLSAECKDCAASQGKSRLFYYPYRYKSLHTTLQCFLFCLHRFLTNAFASSIHSITVMMTFVFIISSNAIFTLTFISPIYE